FCLLHIRHLCAVLLASSLPHISFLSLFFFSCPFSFLLFFFNDTPPTELYTLSLHDALPICPARDRLRAASGTAPRSRGPVPDARSEEHTSELQSRFDLVCRLLLEKKKKKYTKKEE